MDRPRVAITWSSRGPEDALAEYCREVEEAGAVPLVLVAGASDPEATFDALILAGGADVHPRHYGQDVDPRVAETLEFDEARDQFELEVTRAALERERPVFGICRGVQLLNVALGGSLVQDLSLLGVAPAAHNQRGRLERWRPAHPVEVYPGSRLHALLGARTVEVNSFHHQAVARPAPGLRVAARSPDGVVEAVEHPGHPFLLGVQWHPERMARKVAVQRRLFAALVGAARGEGR